MPRLVTLVCAAVATLACSGLVPVEPPAPAPAPVPEPEPEPERSERETDCLANLGGVLTHVPGFPTPDGKPHPGPLALTRGPETDSRSAGSIDGKGRLVRPDGDVPCRGIAEDACLSVFIGNESFGIPVYETRGDRVQIAVGKGGLILEPGARCKHRAWVTLEPPLAVESLGDLLGEDRLMHTLPHWNGVVHDGPDGAPRASGSVGQADFEVKSKRRFAGELWFEVTLLESHCDERKTRGEGWIPAKDDDGRLQVWFYTDC